MTKQHFIALAEAIVQHNRFEVDTYDTSVGPRLFDSDHLKTLADFCHSQNPNFARERWLAYIAGECGSNGGAIKPPTKPRTVTPERKLARRLEGK